MKSKLGFSLVELLVVIAVVMLVGLVTCQAGTVTEPTTFRDVVKFRGSTGPDFDAANVFSIGGTKVEATAAQLNAAVSGVVTGNVPLAGITNALGSAGSAIGGNIPASTITNALVGTAYTTNTLTGDGKTNVFIWATVGPVKTLKSITTTP